MLENRVLTINRDEFLVKFIGKPAVRSLRKIEKENGEALKFVEYGFDSHGRIKITPFGPKL